MTTSPAMDRTENIDGALIQHGPFSDRVFLMKLAGDADVPAVITLIEALAARNGYGKIFVKARASIESVFLAAGYRREGFVEKLYNGTEDGVFLCRYPDPARMHESHADVIADVIAVAKSKHGEPTVTDAPPFRIARATAEDTLEMAELYRTVFKSYPFPIFDPAYLRETMQSHIIYFTARDDDGRLVAASSLERDPAACNAEMTDFAALPECRGKNISAWLLDAMEHTAPSVGSVTVFTIARAFSYGMNATFARLNYCFGGTLINNTQIAGHIESMNIWHKALLPGSDHRSREARVIP